VSPKRLGMTIKRLREQRGLTQEALAKKAHIHRVYVAQIEGQTKVPSLATLEKLAKALGVPVTELLE
jgi:transcriptional regulator with XRE-family HTH domain